MSVSDSGSAPPLGNTGVLPTILTDWFRFRFDEGSDWRSVVDRFFPDRERRVAGWRGWYDVSESLPGGGVLAWCSDGDKGLVEGVLLDVSGLCLAWLGDRVGDLIDACLVAGGRVTRWDFALDDREGVITYERVAAARDEGRVVGRYRVEGYVESIRAGRRGVTFSWGSRSSPFYVRLYDKAAERGVEGHWWRFECECKGALADALVRGFALEGESVPIGEVNRRIRFVDRNDGDGNRWRWAVADWWREFLGSVEKGGRLVAGEVSRSLEKWQGWVDRQVAPVLAVLYTAEGGDIAYLLRLLAAGRDRWRARHKWVLMEVGAG